MRVLRLALLLVWLLARASLAQATIYYVSNGGAAAAGNNSTACNLVTIAAPKLTIGGASGAWACATVPGDIVEVRGGTYVESLVTTAQTLANGTAAAPMVMRAHTGETVTIQPASGCNVLSFNDTSPTAYWTFVGIHINGKNLACGGTATYGVYMGPKSHHLTLQDLTVQDVANATGTTTVPSLGVGGGARYTTLLRVTVNGTHKAFGDYLGGHCVYAGQGTTTESGHHLTIEQGSFSNCGGAGLYVHNLNTPFLARGGACCCKIRYNQVFSNNRNPSLAFGGISLGNTVNGSLVAANKIYSNPGGAGIDSTGGVPGDTNTANTLVSNTLVGNAACLAVGQTLTSDRTILKNNLCKNNTAGITIASGATEATAQNNLLHGGGTQTNSGVLSTVSAPLVGDPLLSNISMNNFHLLTGSAAIDSGQDLTATVPLDISQTAYSVPMEVGAYNFGTTVIPLHLVFLSPPTSMFEDTAFSVVVQVLDTGNALATSYTNTLTIAKASGPGVLGGTLTCTPAGGACTLAGLTLDTPGTITLSVSGTGVTGATSSPFAVVDIVTPPDVLRAGRTMRVR